MFYWTMCLYLWGCNCVDLFSCLSLWNVSNIRVSNDSFLSLNIQDLVQCLTPNGLTGSRVNKFTWVCKTRILPTELACNSYVSIIPLIHFWQSWGAGKKGRNTEGMAGGPTEILHWHKLLSPKRSLKFQIVLKIHLTVTGLSPPLMAWAFQVLDSTLVLPEDGMPCRWATQTASQDEYVDRPPK